MDCCNKTDNKPGDRKENNNNKGFLSGIIYGLIPHIGCIGFIIISILGVTTATAIFKPFLLNRYFFHILILISFIFATISALIYLKNNGILSISGIKRKKGYLLTLYGSTVSINLLLFMLIFPIMTNIVNGASLTSAVSGAFFSQKNIQNKEGENILSIKVDIPCPGHAPLISGEIKTITGVETVGFKFPNLFDISYNSGDTSKEKILSLDVFNTYKAVVINEQKDKTTVQTKNSSGESQSLACDCDVGCNKPSTNRVCGCGR